MQDKYKGENNGTMNMRIMICTQESGVGILIEKTRNQEASVTFKQKMLH